MPAFKGILYRNRWEYTGTHENGFSGHPTGHPGSPMKVTSTWLDSRKASRNRSTRRQDVTVDGREGLVVRVFPSGAASFLFRYTRPHSGKRAWMVFGEY